MLPTKCARPSPPCVWCLAMIGKRLDVSTACSTAPAPPRTSPGSAIVGKPSAVSRRPPDASGLRRLPDPPDETGQAVSDALAAGYRSIDTLFIQAQSFQCIGWMPVRTLVVGA